MASLKQIKVSLIYRKTRPTGNFSMETSFQQMEEAFPKKAGFRLNRFVSSYFSNGFFPRWQAVMEMKSLSADIFHVTGDIHFVSLGLPGERTILTVHDCGFINDSHGIARLLLKYFWLDLPVRRCRWVTAVSEATKRDIIDHTGCPEAKIKVIPTIISSYFERASTRQMPARPTILHIGLAPNKNFTRHVDAIAGLDCQLMIIGKLEPWHVQQLEARSIDYSASYNISEEEMQQTYEDCDLLLFASTLEGFGMPIIEAQTVGRPVVTSNLSSMPEVAGDAACLVDPYSVESIRAGVRRVIEESQYREFLVERGFRNVERFSPAAVAHQYFELYRKMYEE